MNRKESTMSNRTTGFIILVTLICFTGYQGMLSAADKKARNEQGKAEQAAKAKAIDTSATLDSTHPEVEAGFSCNDCHEIKLDAKTTATQVWLSGESPGKKTGEGLMPKEKVWEAVVKDHRRKETGVQNLCARDLYEQYPAYNNCRVYPGPGQESAVRLP